MKLSDRLSPDEERLFRRLMFRLRYFGQTGDCDAGEEIADLAERLWQEARSRHAQTATRKLYEEGDDATNSFG